MKNPLVIGYKGEIGSFILQGLLSHMPKASNIWCLDVNNTIKEGVERIKKADVIFLCIPLQNTPEFFEKWGTNLKNKLIIEQTSLKQILFKDSRFIKQEKNLKILSMHILFRPSATPNFNDRKVAIIETKKWMYHVPVYKFVTSLFSGVQVYKDWKLHDYDMAYQQALVHRTILALDRALRNSMCDQRTYLGERVQELARRIICGDKELYKLIQHNQYSKVAQDYFQDKFKEFDI